MPNISFRVLREVDTLVIQRCVQKIANPNSAVSKRVGPLKGFVVDSIMPLMAKLGKDPIPGFSMLGTVVVSYFRKDHPFGWTKWKQASKLLKLKDEAFFVVGEKEFTASYSPPFVLGGSAWQNIGHEAMHHRFGYYTPEEVAALVCAFSMRGGKPTLVSRMTFNQFAESPPEEKIFRIDEHIATLFSGTGFPRESATEYNVQPPQFLALLESLGLKIQTIKQDKANPRFWD
jgi:hypothetical protein